MMATTEEGSFIPSSGMSPVTGSNRRGKKASTKPNKEVVPVIQIPEETTNLYKKLGRSLPFDNMTVTAYIPTVCVGAVIGKKGTTIAKMQKWAQQLAGIHSDQVRISVVHHPHSLALGGGDVQQQQQQFSPSPTKGMASVVVSDETIQQHQQKTPTSTASPSAPMMSPSNTTAAAAAAAAVIPFTYTELDFSDANWTPVVIRAPTMAGLVVSATILDICLEYVMDRNQIQYIFDLPISSQNQQQQPTTPPPSTTTPTTSSSVVNNAHATIIGKRGQTIMTLSANSNCRIMVPPKQLKHDVVQLEGPLRECTTCLEAIANLLSISAGDSPKTAHNKSNTNSNNNNNNTATTTTPSNNNNNNKSIAKNAQIRSNDNKYQCSFVVRPLPSQTKLRNIARRTETVIRKTRRNKADFDDTTMTSLVEKDSTKNNNNNTNSNNSGNTGGGAALGRDDATPTGDSVSSDVVVGVVAAAETSSGRIPWQLTILGSSPRQVRAASKRLEMFKIADVPQETNINMIGPDNSNNGMDDDDCGGGDDDDDDDDDDDEGDDYMSGTGAGENDDGTDRYSDSESGAAASAPSLSTSTGFTTPVKAGRGGGGGSASSVRGGRRNRSNSYNKK
ncbi:KH domain containing protein [Nitzschia inconspicua]|uniref:KH domain containing protein n=1 Tax=Nitzschia inconspicua TaxID=303405 RepID=A0A9K3KY44_9STRA|nr:KH domain containing protein [Nitzschia inconspicua]